MGSVNGHGYSITKHNSGDDEVGYDYGGQKLTATIATFLLINASSTS